MLPIDIVKSGKARNESFDKKEISLGGLGEVLAGGYPQKSGIKTFEIQYDDGHVGDHLQRKYKQKGLPASIFIEIDWDNNTIRTFFATLPTIGDGFYQDHRTPLYTFNDPANHGESLLDSPEHYDYPVSKGEDGLMMIYNSTRPDTHEPRKNREGAFAEWLKYNQHHGQMREPKIKSKFQLTLEGLSNTAPAKVYHVSTKVVANILNWKQGIKWMYNL